MKKNYSKPSLVMDSFGFQNMTLIATCAHPELYWDPVDMGDGVIFVMGATYDDGACDISDEDYKAEHPDEGQDGPCYYATTSDGSTWGS